MTDPAWLLLPPHLLEYCCPQMLLVLLPLKKLPSLSLHSFT
uniref:Uncharacterized protein n=1 Tax=Anguilla anguilla TaxID=7936 RepID=A0A0E9XAV9_ANGAN